MVLFQLIAAAFAARTLAAPARLQARQSGAGVAAPVATPFVPPGSSGSLRGSPDLGGYSPSNPVDTQDSTVIPPDEFQLAPGQTEDANLGLYLDLSTVQNPQPIRGGSTGPTDPGPRNEEIDRQNSDLFAPPGTDAGDIPNAKWPLGLSHNRHGLNAAGWARQQNVDELPIATAMAGVDMRLSPNAYRELHWVRY